MKRILPVLTLFFLAVGLLSAQSKRAVLPIIWDTHQAGRQSPVYDLPLKEATPFVSYFLRWEGALEPLQIRFSPDGKTWSDWQAMPADEHSPDLPVSILRMTEATHRFFQVEATALSERPIRLECHFFSPGESRPVVESPDNNQGGARSCSDLEPVFLTRDQWCPNGNCPEQANPSFRTVTHLVIHHSAGSNTASDWPAVVRAIWDFHVNGREWADIGYNWLVDPEGTIYQGRGKDAVGAHFCGNNSGTIGICMLGDFTETVPAEKAIATLENLLLWKSCENDIDPEAEVYHASSGATLPTVIGHRDGCATACPGDLFYPKIADIRTVLAQDQTTAVEDPEELAGLQVFPNPATGQVHILLPEAVAQPVAVSLYDLFGRRVMAPFQLDFGLENTRQSISLPENISSGSYFLVFRDGEKILGVRKIGVF